MLVSINPLDADCTSPTWFETARDFYAKMILYGQIPYDEYFKKIRKTFCLQDCDPDARDYLVSLDCLIHNLADLFREGVTIDLPDIR